MVQIKTSELTGNALDYAVSVCENESVRRSRQGGWLNCANMVYAPSSDWAEGGPIIEREGIEVLPCYEEGIRDGKWAASKQFAPILEGDSYLQAAMRCHVASKLGDVVEIPDELVSN